MYDNKIKGPGSTVQDESCDVTEKQLVAFISRFCKSVGSACNASERLENMAQRLSGATMDKPENKNSPTPKTNSHMDRLYDALTTFEEHNASIWNYINLIEQVI